MMTKPNAKFKKHRVSYSYLFLYLNISTYTEKRVGFKKKIV